MAKKRIAIVTPTRDGLVDINFTNSVFQMQKQLGMKYDIDLTLQSGVSDITQGRNRLWNKWYYGTEVEYIFWVDSDIAFKPLDIQKLLDYDVDVIGGNYPKKTVDYRVLLEVASLMQSLDGQVEAERAMEASFSYVGSGRTDLFKSGPYAGLAKTERLGMGCVLISRRGAKKLMDWAEENMEKVHWKWNDSVIEGYPVFNPLTDDEGFQYGEDYSFFSRMKGVGLELYFHPEMQLRHTGVVSFDGCFKSVTDLAEKAYAQGIPYPGSDYKDMTVSGKSKPQTDAPEFVD